MTYLLGPEEMFGLREGVLGKGFLNTAAATGQGCLSKNAASATEDKPLFRQFWGGGYMS